MMLYVALLAIVPFLFTGCFSQAGMQRKMEGRMANQYSSGSKDSELIKTVAFDTGCSEDKIKILDRQDSAGSGMYKIDACGKELKYKRTGTVFHAADKSPY